MRYGIGVVLALIIGGLLGFFGVFVSVFADGDLTERLITIAVILASYGLLSALWGVLLPDYGWQLGLVLALPGTMMLIWYLSSGGFNPYYIIYGLLILGCSYFGARTGSSIKRRR